MKFAAFAPPATTTFAGTVTDLELLVIATEIPPTGAGPLRSKFTVEVVPPATLVGFTDIPLGLGGSTDIETPIDTVSWLAAIFTVVLAATGKTMIDTVPVVAPAGIMAETGDIALLEFALIAMESPPDGAGEPILIVPTAVPPPTILVELRANDVIVGAFTVSDPFAELGPNVALMFTATLDATGTVVTAKVALVFPAAIDTEAPTVAEELEEDSATTAPPEPALAESVTVPVAGNPPTTETEAKVTFETDCALATATKISARQITEEHLPNDLDQIDKRKEIGSFGITNPPRNPTRHFR